MVTNSYLKKGVPLTSFLYLLILGIILIAFFIFSKDGSFENLLDYWYSFLLFIIGGFLMMFQRSLWRKIGFSILTGCIVSLFLQGAIL